VSGVLACTWPLAEGPALVEALARSAGLMDPQADRFHVALGEPDEALASQRIDDFATRIGIEAEDIRATFGEIPTVVGGTAPAILILRMPEPRLLGLVSVRGKDVVLLGTDHRHVRVRRRLVEDALWAPIDRAQGEAFHGVLGRLRVSGRRGDEIRTALAREPFAGDPIEAGWMLKIPPSAPFRVQAQRAALMTRFARMLLATLLGQALALVAWWLVGRAALSGMIDLGLLSGWAILLVTLIPIYADARWSQGLLGVAFSGLLKRRLLDGALRFEAEEVRGQGAGQLLARVMESEAMEDLVLSGGFGSALASLEIVVASVVLALGPSGALGVVALGVWTVVAIVLVLRYGRRAHDWTDARVAMTNDLVERMVGHRTRLAQENPAAWHTDEDRSLEQYVERSARLDAANARIVGLLSRGWLIVGLLTLAPAFLERSAPSAALAIGVGGVLLARGAFQRFAGGLSSLASAQVAWRQVGPIYLASARRESIGANGSDIVKRSDDRGPLLVAQDVAYRYRARGAPVLTGVTLRVGSGERLLVEGPSGGGKSTLGSLLSGLRDPERGLLLLDGLDRHTLGARGWRRRVALAPQFHENHIFANTLLFNLLMGRRWPARETDVEEAIAVCRDLGLGPLLDKMPAGIHQMVGETGWQLSHGERSRVFIARALLQRARLVILDESFAALDPETLATALHASMRRAPTLVVVAHP
jgi:ATP-binding cassette subfamily B protein